MSRLGNTPVVIATTTTRVKDDAGVFRKLVAGQPVPPELVDAYRQAGGETTPQGEVRPAGAVIPAETTYVRDAVGIRRKLVAGQPVPPELVDAYKAQEPEPTNAPEPDKEPAPDGDPPAPVSYEGVKKPDLEAELTRRREMGREITVDGTGQNGNVLAADLVRALEADDAAAAAPTSEED